MAVQWKRIMTMLLKGVSQSRTARAVRCSKRDVSRAARVRERSVDLALLAFLNDREVMERWFPSSPREWVEGCWQPDLDAYVERKGAYRKLPVKLLWYEYRDTARREGVKAYSYQAFCRMFAARAAQLDVTACLEHMPGDKVFIDWSGDCPRLTDPVTGRRMRAQVFVAVLPYSGLIFALATPDQRMASWLERTATCWNGSGRAEHARPRPVRDGGRPHALRLDGDTRQPPVSGVRRILRHRGGAGSRVQATRQGAGAGRPWTWSSGWIVEPSRQETFRTIMDLNDYISDRVKWLNCRHATPGRDSRRERFEAGEQQMLPPRSPRNHSAPASGGRPRCPRYRHIRVEHMNYSVPHDLAGRTLDVEPAAERVVAYDDGIEVVSHSRLHGAYGQYSTSSGHMPENHMNMKSPWSRERFESWAEAIGPETHVMITRLLDSTSVAEQAYVPCNNILNLSKKYGPELLEQVSGEANRKNRTASLTGMRHRILAIRDHKNSGHQYHPQPRAASR